MSDGARFTDLVEEMVTDTEVLNFGVRATGTDQQFLIFRGRPPAMVHDLVILGLFAGDVARNHSRYGVLTSATGEHYEKPYFRLEDGELALHNVPVPRTPVEYRTLDRAERERVYYRGVKYRMRTAVGRYTPWAKSALQRMTRYQPAPELRSADGEAWVITDAIVDQWAKESAAPLLVVAIPPYQYVEGTASAKGYRARFGELARNPAVVVHDVLDDLIAARRSGGAARLRITGDAHYSVAGHRVIARSVAPVVDAMLRDAVTSGGGP